MKPGSPHSKFKLQDNVFDPAIQAAASQLAALIGADISTFTEVQATVARQLAAKAEREKHRKFVHQLLHRVEAFEPSPSFASGPPASIPSWPHALARRSSHGGKPLNVVVDLFLRKQAAKGIGESQHKELARAVGSANAVQDLRLLSACWVACRDCERIALNWKGRFERRSSVCLVRAAGDWCGRRVVRSRFAVERARSPDQIGGDHQSPARFDAV